jgi:hypothetical protein
MIREFSLLLTNTYMNTYISEEHCVFAKAHILSNISYLVFFDRSQEVAMKKEDI